MSILIDIDKVTAVLLPDGWHDVAWKDDESTFELDAYEYVDGDHYRNVQQRGGDPSSAVRLAGGAEEKSECQRRASSSRRARARSWPGRSQRSWRCGPESRLVSGRCGRPALRDVAT